jgi:excisionase family DNA binding protein
MPVKRRKAPSLPTEILQQAQVTSNPTASSHKLYKTPEAAEYLDVSKRTLMTYCAEHRIGYHRYKGGHRFRQSDLDMFLARNYVPAVLKRAA